MASPMVGHLPTNQFYKVLPLTLTHDRVIRKAEAREIPGLGFPAMEVALGATGGLDGERVLIWCPIGCHSRLTICR